MFSPIVRRLFVQGPNCPGPICPGAHLFRGSFVRAPFVRSPFFRGPFVLVPICPGPFVLEPTNLIRFHCFCISAIRLAYNVMMLDPALSVYKSLHKKKIFYFPLLYRWYKKKTNCFFSKHFKINLLGLQLFF